MIYELNSAVVEDQTERIPRWLPESTHGERRSKRIPHLLEQVRGAQVIGAEGGLKGVLELVSQVGPTDSSVLICGETGTGKELIARAIHESSARSERTLVTINCAAISAGLVESELFGHVRGAFTGAHRHHVGRFALVDGGSLFMDEVGELRLDTQAKLLRVLEQGEFQPVGGERTLRTDMRLIAATNCNLASAVADGTFRPDLFYRLNVFPIQLPPLRDRKQDIPALVSHFIAKHEREDRGIESPTEAALALLQAYDWPGNVRELENVIERALIVARSDQLGPESILLPVGHGPEPRPETLKAVERAHITHILERTAWVLQGPFGAAGRLGLHVNTLRSRMRKLGIRRPR